MKATPYTFSYGVNSLETGDVKEHKERVTPEGVTEGEYRWLQPNGLFRVTRYTADNGGYRAVVSEEAGEPVATYYTNTLLGSSQGSFIDNFQSNSQGFRSFQPSNRGSSRTQSFQSGGFSTSPSFQNQELTGFVNPQNTFQSGSTNGQSFQNQELTGLQFQGFVNPQNTFQSGSANGQSFQNQGFSGSRVFQNPRNIINGGIIDGGVIDSTSGTFRSGFNQFGSNSNNFNSNLNPSFSNLNRFGNSGFSNGDINRGTAVVLSTNRNRFFV
ncbi:prion-like-(Q/N-rich) domain-bearing protein 8 [Palaemon carinicauda]|uniref:prion-like-(Q/N-rich) domain-bearing protein 8 n=1 Tax=Palaemon carinicauda TaxID=392227 RepID=UPI0035B62628